MGRVPLTLVLGPANAAKAGEVLRAYERAIRDRAILVVPTYSDVLHYSRELAERGAVIGTSAMTFSGLARTIAVCAGYTAPVASRLQRDELVRRAVAAAQLEVLAPSADGAGFAVAAGALIAELERSLVTPQRFAAAMRAWAAEDRSRQTYAREIAAIYGAYDRALARAGFVDEDLFAWRALDALRAAPAAWGGRPVFFYGFDDLHQLQRDAVETLARVAGAEVTVSLTYEPGRAALAARAEVVQELLPLAQRVIELPAVAEHYEPGSRAALHALERRLFEPGPFDGQIEPGEAVVLLESGGERAEAELVAAEVLRSVRDGVPAGEIAVVHRSPARAAGLLARELEAVGLAVAHGERLSLGHVPLGRAVLAFARCALLPDRVEAAELLVYLRAPGVVRDPFVVDELELAVRREGLRTAAEARARSGLRLAELDSLHDADRPLSELAWQARRLLAAPERGSAPLLDRARELDARAAAAVFSADRELAELDARPDGLDLVQMLEQLEVAATGGGGVAPGSVVVSDPLSIRARRFRVVVVCGLQEGEFPAVAAGDPFLSDEQRRELASASGLRLRPLEDALERERYLFYACSVRPTERLVLSYRSSDEDGNLALRSPFVSDVVELMEPGWEERRRRRLLADVAWDAGEAPTTRAQILTQAAARGGVPADRAGARRVLGEVALRTARHSEVVSPGALESYADCPVKWLVERQLSPDRFGPDPYPLARGGFIHDLLEGVLRELGESIGPETLGEAERVLARLIGEREAPVAFGGSAAVRAAAVRAVHADLLRYLRTEARSGGRWRVAAVEQRFGFDADADRDGDSLPALELGEGESAVRLRGVIDRVDVEPDGTRAVVRDYKSGSQSPRYALARWREDRQLQVALYMLVVRELMGLEPVAGIYQPLSGRELRPRGLIANGAPTFACTYENDQRGPEEFDEELADAAARAVALAASLRSGDLTPAPETCSRFGCAYPGICRSG